MISDLDTFRRMEFKNISVIGEQLLPNINTYISLLDDLTKSSQSVFTKLSNSIDNLKLSTFTESVFIIYYYLLFYSFIQ